MFLDRNPFFLLAASVRDPQARIIELAEERSLVLDSELCRLARTCLTTPRQRLAAEVAWLPGIAPGRAHQLARAALQGDRTILGVASGLPRIAACNLLATTAESLASAPGSAAYLQTLLLATATGFDAVDPDETLRLINEDRSVARFTPVQDVMLLEEQLEVHARELVTCLKAVLASSLQPDQFLTRVVDEFTEGGDGQAPRLIEDLTSHYEMEVHQYLETLEGHIQDLEQRIRAALTESPPEIPKLLAALEVSAREWDRIAQPIQLLAKSRGIEDNRSSQLAFLIRGLAIDLWNDFDRHDESQRLTTLGAELFAELPQFSERVKEDLGTIEKALRSRHAADRQRQSEREQWEREIALDLTIGSDRLRVSGDSIDYAGQRVTTPEVDRVRWGVYKHYVNGIRVDRRYTVWVGAGSTLLQIECARLFDRDAAVQERFQTITDRVWKAVGVRLLVSHVGMLNDGHQIRYGSVIADRRGLVLPRRKFIGSAEPAHFRWEDLQIGNVAGAFSISAKTDKKASAELSYRDVDNVHVLEAIMRFLWKDGNHARLARGELN